jgi:hypothetical protein
LTILRQVQSDLFKNKDLVDYYGRLNSSINSNNSSLNQDDYNNNLSFQFTDDELLNINNLNENTQKDENNENVVISP